MRKALKRLETDRLVVIYPRRGSFATDIHITHLALISDLRLQLEPLPACRAAERATQADRALCQCVLLDGLPALAGQDFRVLAQWDTGLHRLVYRCAGNSYLEATLTQYHSLASRIWYLFADRLSGMAEHVVEHAEVLTAIVDRDPDRAAAVGHQNVRNFERAILAVIEPARDVRWPWGGSAPGLCPPLRSGGHGSRCAMDAQIRPIVRLSLRDRPATDSQMILLAASDRPTARTKK